MAGRLSAPAALLRRNSRFRRLWLARVVSYLGDAMGLVALILFVADEVGGAGAVALLLLAGDALPALASPLLGVVADRFDRRRVLVACELGQAAALAVVVAVPVALAPLLALVAIQSLFGDLFQAAARSAVAELVDDADLERANALIGGGTYGLDALGPLLAAGLLPFLSPRGVLAVDVVTFLVSPLLLAGLPARAARGAEAGTGTAAGIGIGSDTDGARPTRSVRADALSGLRLLWDHPVLRPMALAFVAVVLCNGVDDVALVFLGRDSLSASDAGVSVLYAAAGLGLLAGFLVLVRSVSARGPAVVAFGGFALSSLGNGLTGVAPVLVVAVGFQVVRGLGLSLMDVGPTTLVQRSVPPEARGRVFANLYGAVGLAAGASYALAGPLVAVLSPRIVLAGAGLGGLAVTAVAARSRAGRRSSAGSLGPPAPPGSVAAAGSLGSAEPPGSAGG